MTNELLALCDYPIDEDFHKNLSMKKDFKNLSRLGHSQLIIPLQESLTATLPPTSSNLRAAAAHRPFPVNLPTFDGEPYIYQWPRITLELYSCRLSRRD